MQKYNKIFITKEDIVPTAQKMRDADIELEMIHAHFDDEGIAHVCYEYTADGGIDSYTVVGEKNLPTITHIYDLAAEWAEREIMELMDITFEGVDTSKRLFMPDSMLSGQGQILITPMEELIDITHEGDDKENDADGV